MCGTSASNDPSVTIISTPSSRARSTIMPVNVCQRVGDVLGTKIDTAELEEASERYSEQVTEAVSSDEETSAYVEELEQRAELLEEEEDIPSGESLAAELTRFLREREHGNGGPERGPSEQP